MIVTLRGFLAHRFIDTVVFISRRMQPVGRRLLGMRLVAADADWLTFTQDGLRWTIFAWDESVAGISYMGGVPHQHKEMAAVRTWLEAHGRNGPQFSTLINVGANIGTTAITFARDTHFRVLAIEPVPETFDLLLHNVAQNGYQDRIHCLRTAVSADAAFVEMSVPSDASGGAEVIGRQGELPSRRLRQRLQVPACGLEDILEAESIDPAQVSCVWSDTQGYEAHIIATGARLWRAGVPLFMELEPPLLRHHIDLDDFHALLAAHFQSYIHSVELMRSPATVQPQPLSALPALYSGIRKGTNTDVLLLPRGHHPSAS